MILYVSEIKANYHEWKDISIKTDRTFPKPSRQHRPCGFRKKRLDFVEFCFQVILTLSAGSIKQKRK